MAIRFEQPRASDRISKKMQTVFGGYDHREGAKEGTFWDMVNMSGDYYPLAAPRRGRVTAARLEAPGGIAGHDGLYWVDGDGFYAGGIRRGDVTPGRKRFAFLGSRLVILPDKLYWDTAAEEFGSLEASWTGTASFADGEYAGEPAEGCRIVSAGDPFPFRAGDAVTISGASEASNNQTLVIREISEDGKNLGFFEHSFTVGEGQTLTIARSVPDMDYICENENRLWGCRGDTIYACKPGDPFNWNVFDGLASDSFAVNVGSAGDFTGACSYLGFPIFFKEDNVYKVYGDRPSNFQALRSASLGVMEGSADSLAVAGETLFYLSRAGVMAYTGGVPENISAVFGNDQYSAAVGGSDGVKYYVSMRDESGAYSLYCYDTRVRQWYREDNTEAVGFAYFDGLRMLAADGSLYKIGPYRIKDEADEAEGPVESLLEFGDFTEDSANRKSVCKVQMRLDLDEGATVDVSASFDGGLWVPVRRIEAEGKDSYYLPVILHRCDHYRIRIKGHGMWKLCALVREYAPGSEL